MAGFGIRDIERSVSSTDVTYLYTHTIPLILCMLFIISL
jgi:hypothetical protein